MYKIVADTGCDMFTLNNDVFETVPLMISTDERDFLDDENLDIREMVEYLLSHKGRSYTSCPSTEAWLRAYGQEEGAVPDEIYVVTLTSGLSGTYNSANVAKELYQETHPDTKILLVDSLSVGPEMRMILEKISELKQAGASFEEVAEQIAAYSKQTRLLFAFKSLHNLAENGRVSKLAAAAAGVLGISVYGTASEDGFIQQLGKARGDKRVLASLMDEMKRAGFTGGKVRISHMENEELADKYRKMIEETYPTAEVLIYPLRGLCSFYCERGGICASFEGKR